MKNFFHTAKLIKDARVENKISQDLLSCSLGYSGGQFISNVERGICPLPAEKISDTCAILGLTTTAVIDEMVRDYRVYLEGECL
jgi:hypothetical protein